MPDLEYATIDELWAEFKNRFDCILLIAGSPEKIGEAHVCDVFWKGDVFQSLGMVEFARKRISDIHNNSPVPVEEDDD